MNLIKTSLLNGLAVLVRILSLLGINKLLALYVGPVGYAALGQFQNAMTMITTFASGAINTGVTKYTAEYYDQEQQLQTLWKTAGTIALLGSVSSSFFIILYSRSLASWFLQDEAYASVFIWFALSLVFFVFNALLLSILNGKKEIGRYVYANIAGSLLALVMTTFFVLQRGLYGALVSLAIFQSFSFFVTLYLCLRAPWFKCSYLLGAFDKTIAKQLAGYTLMALTSALCIPMCNIFIRNYLGSSFGWNIAGYWEAMWRLSAAYLLLVTTTLSVYYLPKISELKNDLDLRKEILQGYKIILPTVIIFACLMYLLRDLLISLLFSDDFYPMRSLFLGQVVGDILKIGSWLLAYIMLGRAMTRTFIVTEILFSISFYFIVVLMTNIWGWEAVSWAYVINYLFYWLVMYVLIFKNLVSLELKCELSS